MQVCTSSQTTTPTSHHSVFYRLDALPAAQQQRQSTEGIKSSSGNWTYFTGNISVTTVYRSIQYIDYRLSQNPPIETVRALFEWSGLVAVWRPFCQIENNAVYSGGTGNEYNISKDIVHKIHSYYSVIRYLKCFVYYIPYYLFRFQISSGLFHIIALYYY